MRGASATTARVVGLLESSTRSGWVSAFSRSIVVEVAEPGGEPGAQLVGVGRRSSGVPIVLTASCQRCNPSWAR